MPLQHRFPFDGSSYAPMPWLLSSRGHGVLLDSSVLSDWDLAKDDPDAVTVQVANASAPFVLFFGRDGSNGAATGAAATTAAATTNAPARLSLLSPSSGAAAAGAAAVASVVTPAATLRAFAEWRGLGLIPPPWQFGPWKQVSGVLPNATELEVADKMIDADVPFTVQQGCE